MKTQTTATASTLAAIACVLIAATAPAGFSGSDVFLPMVGRQAGAGTSNWYTTVWIYNPGAEFATARIYLLERGTVNLTPPWVDVMIEPGDTEAIENIVDTLFHKQVFGALRVTCATQKLAVTSRVYSKAVGAGEKDSVGQDFAGVPASFAIGAGERTQILGTYQTLPAADSELRFNFGFVETTGHTANVRVRALDGNGADQGFKDFQVREFSQRQVAFKDHFPTVSTQNTRLEVEVISGTGKVIAYGSGIANASQDPTTFEMAYPPRVLAENATPGITGVTAGQGLTGGGTSGAVTLDIGAGAGISVAADQVAIAAGGVTEAMLGNGSVTTYKIANNSVTNTKLTLNSVVTGNIVSGSIIKEKLSAPGGTSGQVLGTTGTNLVWVEPAGVTLPFDRSISSSSPAFMVANTGAGAGLVGRGSATCCPGVLGENTNGAGVLGLSHVFGWGAVEAVNDSSVTNAAVFSGSNASGRVFVVDQEGDLLSLGTVTAGRGVVAVGGTGAAGTFLGKVGVAAASPIGSEVCSITNEGAGRALTLWANADTSLWANSNSGAAIDARSTSGFGVTASSAEDTGVLGVGELFGVRGEGATGIWGESGYTNGIGTAGVANGALAWAIYGASSTGEAGHFAGRVAILGNLSVSGGISNSVIDHPLDPANRVLVHAAVESSEVLNVYSGNVTTDDEGVAVVQLPDWFEAVNTDFRYQLTCIGRFAQAIVERQIEANRFTIRTNLADVEVSWLVTARRNDAWVQAHPFAAEQEKTEAERGYYLTPDAFGQGEAAGIEWATHPALARRAQRERAPAPQTGY
jgi:hypothetical protein